MASRNEAKLGFDPLAWMKEEDGDREPKPAARSSGSGSRGRKKAGGRRRARAGGDGAPSDVELLETSFALLAPRGEELVERFYEELLARYPAVAPMFANTDMEAQKKKLLAALKLVVEHLRRPEQLSRALQVLGRKHQAYGAMAEHYPAVAGTLLDVMAELAGEHWNDELQRVWTAALDQVAEAMLGAYEETGEDEMASHAQAGTEDRPAGTLTGNLEAMMDVLEHAPVNIMMADAEERIVFVNKKARDVLTELEDELATYLPGFRADQVVGGSIHRYHRDPDAIRRILHALGPGDVRHGEIRPGRFIFEHETRPLFDRRGNRLGYVVQWHDATEQRARAEEAARLQKAMDGAQTAIMTIDRDLNITYVNDATRKLLAENEETLRALYPGFSADRIVGSNIDQFHRNPAHQRQLLADPRNLPYETDIQVGPLTFRIRVSAIHDLDGNYVGSTMEWSDVTARRKAELEVARLKAAVEGTSITNRISQMQKIRSQQLVRCYMLN